MTGRSRIWKRTVHGEAGRSFGSMVREEAAAVYDKVLFVDAVRGSDAAEGDSWDTALQSINGAMDKLYGGDDSSTNYPGDARARAAFAVIYRGYLTGGNAYATQQIIDVSGVHLIGAGIWEGGAGSQFESTFVVDGSKLTANPNLSGLPSTYAGLIIEADACVVDGIYFYHNNGTNSPFSLAISDYETHSGSSGHANAGRGCGVFNSVFQGDVNGALSIYGLGLSGAEACYGGGNHFRYNKIGFVFGGGPNRYANSNHFSGDVYAACERALQSYNASVAENTFERGLVTDKSTYGFSLVAGIDCTTGAGTHAVDWRVGHVTKTTAYVVGTGNLFTNCFYNQNVIFPT